MAQVVLNPDGKLVFVNERAEALFGLLPRDLGRPFQDLELSYRPVELRSLLDQAASGRRAVWAQQVTWVRGGEQLSFDVQVQPLLDDDGVSGMSIVFHDVTVYRRLQDELERSNRQLESAYEELQSTNEELETTNEELQSTVEELETTNEELQSTNEELETMNEELQSTNDEFQSINEELRERSEELDAINAFMQSVLTSLRSGVIVVDRDLRVTVWNEPSEQLWGVRQDEAVSEHLMALDIGLPVEDLRQPLRLVLGGGADQQLTVDAVDRRGRAVRVRVAVSPLGSDDRISGAVLLFDLVDESESVEH
jgi:two-component system CheB/CheR fusion protein